MSSLSNTRSKKINPCLAWVISHKINPVYYVIKIMINVGINNKLSIDLLPVNPTTEYTLENIL